MKVSVSLSEDDLAFLDAYAKANRLESRSAVLKKAVRLLRASELEAAYEGDWREWAESGIADEWDGMG